MKNYPYYLDDKKFIIRIQHLNDVNCFVVVSILISHRKGEKAIILFDDSEFGVALSTNTYTDITKGYTSYNNSIKTDIELFSQIAEKVFASIKEILIVPNDKAKESLYNKELYASISSVY